MTRTHIHPAAIVLISLGSIIGCGKKEPAKEEPQTQTQTQTTSVHTQETTMMAIEIESSAFMQGAAIPETFTCDGKDVSPVLTWGSGPEGTRAWALIVDDPDAPSKTWVHWVLYNLPDSTRALSSGVPSGDLPGVGTQGKNDFGKQSYGGPCPPPGKPHRYFFRLYALDAPLDLPAGATRDQVDRAMEGHILGRGELMGTYARRG